MNSADRQTEKGCLSVVYFSKPGRRLLSAVEEEVVVMLWVVSGVGECIWGGVRGGHFVPVVKL